MLPPQLIYALYTASISERVTLTEQKDKLLDCMVELTVDRDYLKRQNKIMSNMILDKDKEIAALNLEVFHQEATIAETKEQLQLTTSELTTTSIELQKALAAYSAHA